MIWSGGNKVQAPGKARLQLSLQELALLSWTWMSRPRQLAKSKRKTPPHAFVGPCADKTLRAPSFVCVAAATTKGGRPRTSFPQKSNARNRALAHCGRRFLRLK